MAERCPEAFVYSNGDSAPCEGDAGHDGWHHWTHSSWADRDYPEGTHALEWDDGAEHVSLLVPA
jgi:hypothetical protein